MTSDCKGVGASGVRGLLLCGAAGLCALAPLTTALAQDAPPAATPPPADERRVDINEYDVAGNTLLAVIDIQNAVYPFEGPGRTIGDTDKARAALQKLYADRGYQAVSVVLPPQSVQGGVVRLQVVEAKTAQVTVKGRKFVSQAEVLGGLTALQPGQSPNFKALNAQLVALNTRSADLQVTPQLKPGSLPDTLDVELDVEDKSPVHGSLELNNNYSADTHPLRLQGNIAYDDLWHMGHSLSALVDIAPQDPNDAQVYALTYSAPIPGTDIRLSLTGLDSNSNVSTLGSTDVIGKGYSITLNADAPLPSVGNFSQSLQTGIAYKHFTDVISLKGVANTAPVTYLPISLTYSAGFRTDKDLIAASVAANFAFRGLGSGDAAFDNKRYLAQGNFFYLHGSASWQRDLPLAFQAYGEVDGQLSDEPLISNEQFSAGGQGSVRGYLQSEALGDSGFHGTAELRTPPLEHFADPGGVFLNSFRFLVFVDAAHAWLIDPLPEQTARFGLSSVGVGFRSTLARLIHLDADLGEPLQTSTSTKPNHPRVDFRLYSNF
jgi:hemolysin activation/secretion protein